MKNDMSLPERPCSVAQPDNAADAAAIIVHCIVRFIKPPPGVGARSLA
jgi:hypothetical protein